MKRYISTFIFSLVLTTSFAQSGTNSPYSQYGLGSLVEQTNSFNRGMNGVGIALHSHNQINSINPASYSELDSITFLFDAGMTMQITNYAENGIKKNVNNSDIEYVMGAFRVKKNMGMAFGIRPYSKIGYNYSYTSQISGYDPTNSGTSYHATHTFSGKGGINEIFLGAGYKLFKGASIGVNCGYLWGTTDKIVANSYSDSYVNTLTREYSYSVGSYMLDAGLQYSTKIGKKNELTVGLTYRLGHNLSCDPELQIISTNSTNSVADTSTVVCKNGLAIPDRYGIGLAWNHNNKLRVGLDYTLDKWASVDFPQAKTTIVTDPVTQAKKNIYTFDRESGYYKDRHKFNIGLEYCDNENGRSYMSKVRYSAGFGYATPYINIKDNKGPGDLSASIGIGLPIINGYNTSRMHYSVLNISAQWVRTSMPNAIKENTFRINLGLTFSERWFAKWKFD